MKKHKSIRLVSIICALIISAALSIGASAESIPGFTTTDVNLRTEPSLESQVIDVVGEGSALTIKNTDNPSWYEVETSWGASGYMSSQYINTAVPQPPVDNPSVSESYVTTTDVNMRTGPSTDYYVITTLDYGTSLTVTDKSNPSWYGVQLGDGTTGYVCAEYLTPSGNSQPDPQPPVDNPSVGESYVTTTDLNMRTGPSTDYYVIKTLDYGTSLTVTDKSNP